MPQSSSEFLKNNKTWQEKMLNELNKMDNESMKRVCKTCKYDDKQPSESPCCSCKNGGKYKSINEIEENKPMEVSNFAIFMNNGDVITLKANHFSWQNTRVIFYSDEDEDNIIAIFKISALYAVTECEYELHEKQLMLPKFDDEEEKGDE